MKKAALILFWLLFSYTAAANADISDILIEKIPFLSEYTTYQSEQTDEITVVSFYGKGKQPIKISAKSDGAVISFVKEPLVGMTAKKSLPQISKGMAYRAAQDFLNVVASDILIEINKYMYSNTYSFASAGFNLRFSRIVNGISYPNDWISIFVDGKSGQVLRYSRNWNDNIIFESADEIISLSDAEESFKENIGLQLRYGKRVHNSVVNAGVIYVPARTSPINALTGAEAASAPPLFSDGYSEMIAMHERDLVAASVLEAEQTDEIYSVKDARQYIKKIGSLRIDDSFTVDSAKYYKNADGSFLITLTFVKEMQTAGVTLNAKTLDIIGFLNDKPKKATGGIPIDNETAKQIAAKFLAEHKAAFLPELSAPQVIQEVYTKHFRILYERNINNIPFKGNYITFVINESGDIISMACVWDNIKFDDLSGILSPADAYDLLFKTIGFRLTYIAQDNSHAMPVYIVNPQMPAIIDAKTGDILTYDGSIAPPQKSLGYIGLDGHYAAVPITVLADCDIYISQGNVILDDYILQKDFILMLATVSPENLPVYEKQSLLTEEELSMVYASFTSSGVLEKDEIDPIGYVTRAEAVKYLIRIAGYKEVAELSGIYKIPFMDAHKIAPELYGYVGLARGMGLVSGSGGYFNPNQNLTNADALILIYNYLNN